MKLVSIQEAKVWAKQCFDLGREVGKSGAECIVKENGTIGFHAHVDNMIDEAILRAKKLDTPRKAP